MEVWKGPVSEGVAQERSAVIVPLAPDVYAICTGVLKASEFRL